MGKPDGLFRCCEQEKCGIDSYLLDEVQLLDLVNNCIGKEKYGEDVELEGIDVVRLKNKNRLWIVAQEHRMEVLCQHHYSDVTGHWTKYSTQELVSQNCV